MSTSYDANRDVDGGQTPIPSSRLGAANRSAKDSPNGSTNGSASSVKGQPTSRSANGAAAALSAPEQLKKHLLGDKLTRIALTFLDNYMGIHLKDEIVDDMDDERRMRLLGHSVYNFGSDSFLGLDRHPRLLEAMNAATVQWGTHNGSSRAFGSIALCDEAERRLARWLGVEDTLIYTSVTLANAGLLPAVTREGDWLVVDRQSHDSIQQAAKIAAADGANLIELHPCEPKVLQSLLDSKPSTAGLVVAVDGVYSMNGRVPPLLELDEIARRHNGILYVDDAHGTGVVGPGGRGSAYQTLGDLNNVLMVGSLSKGFSCMGGFVTCGTELKRILKIRSSTFIFGGPVPPSYLAAICAVVDIIESDEYETIRGRLDENIQRFTGGLDELGLVYYGGVAPIVSILVGDIEKTFEAGKRLFDSGYFVQSATYPAVSISGGLLRVQISANHSIDAVDGLLNAIADLHRDSPLPIRE
ncbi:MAG: pyridoxal phosphate-dependent aminotransferase family protein [Pirellulaceae bacterium]|jgi:7-keto-8-aminopelargonate synthetase-like enzyme|nr:pyridoxal phosphate-dependent aminotransferase family protein [Pirellulaceae bacterium]